MVGTWLTADSTARLSLPPYSDPSPRTLPTATPLSLNTSAARPSSAAASALRRCSVPIAPPPDADASDSRRLQHSLAARTERHRISRRSRSPTSAFPRFAFQVRAQFHQGLRRRAVLVVDQGHQQVFGFYHGPRHSSRRHPRDFQDSRETSPTCAFLYGVGQTPHCPWRAAENSPRLRVYIRSRLFEHLRRGEHRGTAIQTASAMASLGLVSNSIASSPFLILTMAKKV